MNEKVKNDSLSQDSLIKLVFNLNAKSDVPEWTEDGKELRYKNEMYDVVKTLVEKNSVTYYCIKDKEENNLLDNLVSMIKKSFGNDKNNQFDYSKDLSKYTITSLDDNIKLQFLNFFCPGNVPHYKSLHKQINSPPPKCV